jgi:hypothetical protein
VTLDQDQGEIIVGFNDGMVKFYDISKAEIEARSNTISAFTNIFDKKGAVSCLKIHPANGALFGSTTAGCLKLLRLSS